MPTATPTAHVNGRCPKCQKLVQISEWDLEATLIEVERGKFRVVWFLKGRMVCKCGGDCWRAIATIDTQNDTKPLLGRAQ